MTIIDLNEAKSETVQAMPFYRWAVRKGTHTDAPKLQQAWRNMGTGEVRWRNVDMVAVDDEEFYQK